MVAGAHRASVLEPARIQELGIRNQEFVAAPWPDGRQTSEPQVPARYSAVSRVLARVLLLNVGVALAKIVFGYATGAISILSDGLHSLTDGASNVVGMIGVFADG